MDILKPDLKLFKEKYDSGVKQVLFTSFAADVHTPISSLLKLEKEKYLFLFESVERGSKTGPAVEIAQSKLSFRSSKHLTSLDLTL